MEKKTSKGTYVLLSIVLVATLMIATVGATYAYFRAQVTSVSVSSITVTTADLKIEYKDTATLVGTDVIPGWSGSKTFTIENKGEGTASYTISWKNVTNGLTNTADLTYTLSATGGTGSCSKTATVFPTTSTASICEGSVLSGVANKQTYTLTVSYENKPAVDQSSDMGSSVVGTIDVVGKQISQAAS